MEANKTISEEPEPPWLRQDAAPPHEWLHLVATELLETTVSADWLAAEWDTAAQDCSVPLMKTNGELRARLMNYPGAFQSTMIRLGGRIADKLKGKVEFEWEEFFQTLLERAEMELLRRGTIPATKESADSVALAAAAADEAEPEAETPERSSEAVKEEATDPVFARHREAQKTSLVQKGKDDLIRLARSGKCGLDGELVANGWLPAVAHPDGMRSYAEGAAPRGTFSRAAEKAPQTEGNLDDMHDSAYDSEPDDESDDDLAVTPGRRRKRKRSVGAKSRLQATLGECLVFWCASCSMTKPLRSLKAIEAHRNGKKSCVRSHDGRRNATIDDLRTDGYLFFSEPPQTSTSAGSRSRGACGRHGRGGRGGSGRGTKSEATKIADKARVAAILAIRKEVERAGGSWDPLRGRAVVASSPQPEQSDQNEVECLGEWTREEAETARYEAGTRQAINLVDDD